MKQLIEELDASHKELLAKLEQQFADRLEELKIQQDKQYDNLRTTISDLALQQRYGAGGCTGGNPTSSRKSSRKKYRLIIVIFG